VAWGVSSLIGWGSGPNALTLLTGALGVLARLETHALAQGSHGSLCAREGAGVASDKKSAADSAKTIDLRSLRIYLAVK
jgi:hypothetical protein